MWVTVKIWDTHKCGRLYYAFFGGVILVQVFVNARLHVSGGALGGGRMVEDASSVAGL
jgi:hypothetical protein